VQEVLLRLVGADQHHALLGEGTLAPRLDPKQALERRNARTGSKPIVVAVPAELGAQGFCHAPAVRKAKLREHSARGSQAEILDQIFSQQPHRHCVEQQRALASEADDPTRCVQFQQLFMIEIVDAHLYPSLLRIEGGGTSN